MFSWPDSPEFHEITRRLSEVGLLKLESADGVVIREPTAFHDLLFAVFSAWAFRSLGRQDYHVRFVMVDKRHTALVYRRNEHPSVFPEITRGPHYNDNYLTVNTLRGLKGKLLYNADISPRRAELPSDKLEACATRESLRDYVIEQTLADPDLFGWLWGGQLIPIGAPAALIEDLVANEQADLRGLTRLFEQILCLHLAAAASAFVGECHISDPRRFSEIDLLLYFPTAESRARGRKKHPDEKSLRDDVAGDRVFVLENSAGLGGFEAELEETVPGPGLSAPSDDHAAYAQRCLSAASRSLSAIRARHEGKERSEPERRWHQKLINQMALKQIGFESVMLYLCSLYPIDIASPALRGALGSGDVSYFSLDKGFYAKIREGTPAVSLMRENFNLFVEAALREIRRLRE